MALDDGEIDFATSKRRGAEALPLQDGDVIPSDVEDEDELEALDFDEIEDILDAEQGLQSIEDEAADLDDHPVPSDDADNDDGKDDDNNDDGRHHGEQDPSALNHTWGPFRFTMTHDVAKHTYAWQCACPFHRKKGITGCKKRHALRLSGDLSFEAESDRMLDSLKHWANQAHKYNRQIAVNPSYHQHYAVTAT